MDYNVSRNYVELSIEGTVLPRLLVSSMWALKVHLNLGSCVQLRWSRLALD